ncbi:MULTISPECIES: NAD(P)/FAD-dependent oxidoreductase [unclassified Lentimicrobium]|uniref:NAD(P)/FAD-dependent oxidoreductase n=1 Tax=unclassified Lentimicrobium TaxID=2677434 RepID=UPI001553D96B|nr:MULTISPECIES: NAD(P)/FAD-dependent oxidoreductase [unclassified Lentimicrobium]NPD45641.1 NAD(P)/FAD-dependent oxidoreductase [Lentimicrobium sp. S6]NPD85069.1 NAD(P)/FAD-dependent oxidoreductase [Lentimicrobium sp. L6]
MNIPDIDLPRIVVIGCGFAGLKFSKKIDSKKYQVVLLDKNNYHTFQPLLYQVASSGLEPDSIVYPIRKIFKGKPNFYFRLAETKSINAKDKTVETNIGPLSYDYLVIATGATSNFFGMDNIKKYSMSMKNLIDALDLRSLIIQNFENALNTSDLEERERLMNFVIVGAGPTGIELAGALAELKAHVLPNDYPDLDIRRMQIHIVEANDRVLAAMSSHASEKSEKYLKSRDIHIWLKTFVKDYDGKTVFTSNKNFQSNTLIWAAGIKGQSPLGIDLKKTKDHRIIVDEFNTVKGFEKIYSIGDVASVQTEASPKGHAMLASVAEQQGNQLANNFNRKANKKKMLAFRYQDKGTMATIGRNKAVVDLSFIKFGGFAGWFVWMFVHLMLLVDFRSRLVVFINWVWSYINYDKGTRLIVRKYLGTGK